MNRRKVCLDPKHMSTHDDDAESCPVCDGRILRFTPDPQDDGLDDLLDAPVADPTDGRDMGAEAVALLHQLGIVLVPWQEQAVRTLFGPERPVRVARVQQAGRGGGQRLSP